MILSKVKYIFNRYIKKRLKQILIILIFIEVNLQCIALLRYSILLYKYTQHQTEILKSNWFLRDPANAWWLKESPEIIAQGHPFFGFIHKNISTPNIHFDSEGIRRTIGNPPLNTPGLKKIFFFGGSTMAGHYLKDGETIPSVITKILNTESNKYLLVNYGQFGYSSNNEIVRLLFLLKQGDIPDVAVFYDGCNDLILGTVNDYLHESIADSQIKTKLGNLVDVAKDPPPVNTTLINVKLLEPIVTYIKILHYPVVAIEKILHITPQRTQTIVADEIMHDNATVATEISNNYINNVQLIEQLAEVYKFKPIFIWQPLLFNKTMTKDEQNNKYLVISEDKKELYQSITKLIFKANAEHYYDLTNVFQNDNTKSRFVDTCHVTPEANVIIAKRISELIQEEINK